MSAQETMKSKLESLGLPFKEIRCYGSQIVITTWSESAASQWSSLVSKFAKLRGVTKSIDDCKFNKNTVLVPSVVKVWRVFASI